MKKTLIVLAAVGIASGTVVPRAFADSNIPASVISEVMSGLHGVKTNLLVMQQVETGKLAAIRTIAAILGNIRSDLVQISALPAGQEKTARLEIAKARVGVAVNAAATLNSIDAKEREVLTALIGEVQALANRLK